MVRIVSIPDRNIGIYKFIFLKKTLVDIKYIFNFSSDSR